MLDFIRRDYVSNLLTQVLEVDINRKTGIAVRMLSINFMHPPSLLTWLEMRRMVFDVGKRFYIRIQGNIVCFMIIVFGQIALLTMATLGYLQTKPLIQFWHWITIALQVVFMLGFNWPAL